MIRAGRCTVQQGDVSALTLPNQTFDLATAFETIYFWPDLAKCFVQVAGILKPGGVFMIVNESDGTDKASRGENRSPFRKNVDYGYCKEMRNTYEHME